MIKIELIDIYPKFSEISPELENLLINFCKITTDSRTLSENIEISNDDLKDEEDNILSFSFYTDNSFKKDEKLKVKLTKKDSNIVIGIGEIVINSNPKSKKEIITKKWFNISSSNSNSKDINILSKRGSTNANFALNLINLIKIHLRITEYPSSSNSFNTSKNFTITHETAKSNAEERIKDHDDFKNLKNELDLFESNKVLKNNQTSRDFINTTKFQNKGLNSSTIFKEKNNLKPVNENKKEKNDLSQSMNTSNFQMLKGSLNNSHILNDKRPDRSVVGDRLNDKNKEDLKKNLINKPIELNKSVTRAKNKNISLDTSEGLLNKSNLMENESPKQKGGNKKEISNKTKNSVKSTTNQSSVNFKYDLNPSAVEDDLNKRVKNENRNISDRGRNLSSNNILKNTNLNKDKVKIAIMEHKQANQINIEPGQLKIENDEILSDASEDENFKLENYEYFADPLSLNNFKENIDEFKCIYNENYIKILPEEETYLGMETKMLIDKFYEIDSNYKKTIGTLYEDNKKLHGKLSYYMERYSNYDKKKKNIEHLFLKQNLDEKYLNTRNLNYDILSKTTKMSNSVIDFLKCLSSGKISNKKFLETEEEKLKFVKKKTDLKENLLKIIKNIINNPKNSRKINENIYPALELLEKSIFGENKNIEKENNILYHSPHFQKENSELIKVSDNNLNLNKQNSDDKDNYNSFNKKNFVYENNTNNIITLNDISSSNVSPDTNKKIKSLLSSGKNNEEEALHDSFNESEDKKSNQYDSKSSSKTINHIKSLFEEKLKEIYAKKSSIPRIDFRYISGTSYYYGTIKLKLTAIANNIGSLKVTWKKNNNYINTTIEEFIEANAVQQDNKISKTEIIQNKNKSVIKNKKEENLTKSPVPNKKK